MHFLPRNPLIHSFASHVVRTHALFHTCQHLITVFMVLWKDYVFTFKAVALRVLLEYSNTAVKRSSLKRCCGSNQMVHPPQPNHNTEMDILMVDSHFYGTHSFPTHSSQSTWPEQWPQSAPPGKVGHSWAFLGWTFLDKLPTYLASVNGVALRPALTACIVTAQVSL